jgi:asparagine synthase (glutamine-hydrolysing)
MRGGFEIQIGVDNQPEVRILGEDPRSTRLVDVAKSGDGALAAALIGRLFLDDESSGDGRAAGAPAGVLLNAYRRQGPEGLAQLDGEFAFVLIDLTERRLIARRDPRGTFPLYFSVVRGRPIIGTSLRSLVDRLPGRQVSAEYLACFLSFPFAFSELPGPMTAWTGVERIRPEDVLEIDFRGRSRVVARWNWEDNVTDQSHLSFEETRCEFLRLVRRSIARRSTAGRVGAHLSGGMDSSGIACLARKRVADRPGGDKLSTFSLTYSSRLLAGEQQLMQEVINLGAIDPHLLPGDDALHFDWFSQPLPVMDEPYAGLFELSSQRLMAGAAAAAQVDVLLTGIGIEHSLEGTRLHIADLLRAGRPHTAWQIARAWGRAANVRAFSVFAEQGLVPLLTRAIPSWADALCGALAPGGSGSQASDIPWVSPEFARRYDLRGLTRRSATAPFRAPYEKHFTLFGLTTTSGNWGAWTFLAPQGIQLSHPYLDTDLVRFCLGVRREYKEQPGCRKRLLREALAGELPDSIRCRRFKRGFNDVFWRGLSRSLPQLRRLIRDTELDELGVIDCRALERSLQNVAMGVGETQTGGRLAGTLALIAWHAQRDRPCDLPVRETISIRQEAFVAD